MDEDAPTLCVNLSRQDAADWSVHTDCEGETGFMMQGIQEWEDSTPVWPNRGTTSKHQLLIFKGPR